MKYSLLKDYFKVILLGIIVLIAIAIIYQQWRHFYELPGQTITVWKRYGGDCYIMPYKYTGITLPEKDYIVASNIGGFTVVIKPDSSYVFFAAGPDSYNLNIFLDNYKYEYLHPSNDSYKSKWKEYKKYPWMRISIREPYIEEIHPNGYTE